MGTLERYYIYKETKSNNQINDKLTVKPNAIFESHPLLHTKPAALCPGKNLLSNTYHSS